jgi:thioredoxin reductase (NADPH)
MGRLPGRGDVRLPGPGDRCGPNIVVRYHTEVVDGHGNGHLTALTLKDRTTGTTETAPATALFILIGAEPHTDWLPETICRVRWGSC